MKLLYCIKISMMNMIFHAALFFFLQLTKQQRRLPEEKETRPEKPPKNPGKTGRTRTEQKQVPVHPYRSPQREHAQTELTADRLAHVLTVHST